MSLRDFGFSATGFVPSQSQTVVFDNKIYCNDCAEELDLEGESSEFPASQCVQCMQDEVLDLDLDNEETEEEESEDLDTVVSKLAKKAKVNIDLEEEEEEDKKRKRKRQKQQSADLRCWIMLLSLCMVRKKRSQRRLSKRHRKRSNSVKLSL